VETALPTGSDVGTELTALTAAGVEGSVVEPPSPPPPQAARNAVPAMMPRRARRYGREIKRNS